MKSAEIRNSFLRYFEGYNHRIVPSSPLIPHGDPTLLFSNAGMNQFKDIFTGKEKPSYSRAASSQKCMRVSGKHNDLEEVGISPYHQTFFEMLGNFSFGDYFKKEAIFYGWEWVTRTVGLPKENLYVTVYEDDDEAFELWEKTDDFLKKNGRILRFGKKDNYWAMGDTGPNGPCSEIHYDRGADFDGELNISGDRFLELWNLVFMQFETDESGVTKPLPKPSVDTGAGLERFSLVLQGKESNYDTDLFKPIIDKIEELSGKEYFRDDKGIPHRVIADHLRALTFCFSDGAFPSNEGRGYVLRRILRRASYHCRLLGITEPFIYRLVPALAQNMGSVYPEIVEKEVHTTEIIKSEEEAFGRTLDRGLEIFSDVVRNVRSKGQKVIPGEDAFKLYDTYGFPLDLTQIMAAKEGLDVDTKIYEEELERQQERSRAGVKISYDESLPEDMISDFVGYATETVEAEVAAVLSADDKLKIILNKTPFYAEAGGQIGDTGFIEELSGEWKVVVEDTQKQGNAIIHLGKTEQGAKSAPPKSGQIVRAVVDSRRRNHIRRNHTATHLLHKALREVLGEHATQAGSYVGPDYLRFDFSHYKAMTNDELSEIEYRVNRAIMADYPVMPEENVALDNARKEGAMALFGEKYGETVRVIRIKNPDNTNFSIELCGGTHVSRTGEIGAFVITSESAIAAGMRRIEALTGEGALRYFKKRDELVRELGGKLKATPEEIIGRVENLLEKNKELSREVGELSKLKAADVVDDLIQSAVDINGYKVVAVDPGISDRGEMMDMADALRDKLKSGVGVLGTIIDSKVALVTVVTDNLIKERKIKAGDIIKEVAALVDGKGGGKAHLAQAGGKSPEKLPDALKKVPEVVEKFLK
ncbi:MAG: alanine--tRNA ligase [candidate division Zixibacteria bacterium]|nr:alanine--tRNA ligase [candidate division Zixibacteria bacterium]